MDREQQQQQDCHQEQEHVEQLLHCNTNKKPSFKYYKFLVFKKQPRVLKTVAYVTKVCTTLAFAGLFTLKT